jgi:hypothetical protein
MSQRIGSHIVDHLPLTAGIESLIWLRLRPGPIDKEKTVAARVSVYCPLRAI